LLSIPTGQPTSNIFPTTRNGRTSLPGYAGKEEISWKMLTLSQTN
jgi:hypothetical protein